MKTMYGNFNKKENEANSNISCLCGTKDKLY